MGDSPAQPARGEADQPRSASSQAGAPVESEVERLFHEAAELPAAQREAHVRRAAPGELAEEVLALLRADAGEPHAALREPVLEPAIADLRRSIAPARPERAGPWTLGEVLFTDGTGVISAARDAGGQQRVVKTYHAGGGRDPRRAQRQERVLTDSLEYPGFPRLLGFSGRNEEPYLVWDCEPGVGLARFCDQARVPVPGRLELFCHFGATIAQAHERGAIHGSITPAKLRCEERAGGLRLLVLGFGAANPPLESPAALDPDTGGYLAPEAWYGSGAPDTMVDVYGLGSVLYELLCGEAPISPGAFLARVACGTPGTTEPPPAPGQRLAALGARAAAVAQARCIDAPGLVRLLRERLDPIVMAAIELEPGRRHNAASVLVARVREVLAQTWPDHEPTGFGERIVRWMRALFGR